MENVLIMFTKTFPYGNGESFVEKEIDIISKEFKRIILFCCQVSDSEAEQRSVPNNVKVIPFKSKRKLALLIKGGFLFLQKSHRNSLFREFKECHSMKKKLFTLYFYSKTINMLKNIVEEYDNWFIENKEKIFFTFYSYWFFDLAYLAILLQKKYSLEKNSIIISRAHGYDVYKERNSIGYFPFRTDMLKGINGVYVCSLDGMNYLQHEYPEYLSKIKYAYLGTSDKGFSIGKRCQEKLHIVTCSNIIGLKRVKKVAEACQLLEEENILIKWTCFGDGELKADLVDYCNQNLDTTEVCFKGHCSNEQVLEYYRNHYIDVFINVSETEGLPVSIMEAVSFGIPAIATDVGGTSEIVVQDITGDLLKKDFLVSELAEEIKKYCYMDDVKRTELRSNCREYWKNHFNADINYKKFSEELRRVRK